MSQQNRVFNFSAGPAVLPLSVLEEIQKDMISYKGCGMSVMEMSHRSKQYEAIISETEAVFRRLLSIPEDYAVLFLQGGASLQFSMVPQNLYIAGKPVDVVMTGAWTQKAVEELKKIGEHRIVATSEPDQFTHIPQVQASQFNPDASFTLITSNNTIFGTQWASFPDMGAAPVVADMSSDILSRPVDVSKFGVIYAGAQKNLGPSGVTLVIIKKDLAERASKDLPTMLQYRTHIKNGSMYNTPPAFGIYVMGLVGKWIEEMGGVRAIEKKNQEKAGLLYEAIDQSDFYYCPNQKDSRSLMNVVFRIKGNNAELEAQFASEAAKAGLLELKGHRSVGGLRASLYNAQPIEAVQALTAFMKKFQSQA